MAQSYINSFSPMTPIGQGLQNITTALFGGRPPVQRGRDEAAMEASRAQAIKFESDAAKADAQRLAIEQQTQGRQGFLDNTYSSLMPPDDMHAARNFITGAPVLAFEDQRQPRPGSLTPDVETQIRRAHSLHPAVMAGSQTSSISDIAKAMGLVQEQGFRDQTSRGDMSPTRFAQVRGLSPFAVQGDTLVNTMEGALGPTTEIGGSRIATQGTQQGAHRAQAAASYGSAAASNARAGLTGDQRVRLSQTPIGLGGRGTTAARPNDVVAELPDRSTEVMTRDEAVAQGYRILGKPAAVQPRNETIDLNKGQRDQIYGMAASELGIFSPKTADPAQVELLNEVVSVASHLRSLRLGGAKSEAEAVQMAIQQLGIKKDRTLLTRSPNNKRGAAEPGQAASGQIGRPGAAAAGGLPAPKTRAEYDRLPPGAEYIGTDGIRRMKGGA